MSYELEGEPMLVRRNGAYLLNVDVDLGASDIADVYEAAADVIRRIQGVEKIGEQSSRLRTDADYLRSDYPIAARYFEALADWLHGGSGDFTPPADADAIAASERRGADKREQEIIGFIDRLATTKNSAGWIADRIRQGDHLYGGESDDA